VRQERAAVVEVLSGAALDVSDLRRALRERAGRGPGVAQGSISRSAACKAAFARADAAAGGSAAYCLHLLAALLEEPDDAIRDVLADRRIGIEGLPKRVRAFAGIRDVPSGTTEPLSPAARAALAAAKAEAPEAGRGRAEPPAGEGGSRMTSNPGGSSAKGRLGFAGEAASLPDADGERATLEAAQGFFRAELGARELRRAVERLIEAPLAELVLSGELSRHRTYEPVRDGDAIRVRSAPDRP
jgi:ATP-dependent Clp protease ATP-binding subunit ClpA